MWGDAMDDSLDSGLPGSASRAPSRSCGRSRLQGCTCHQSTENASLFSACSCKIRCGIEQLELFRSTRLVACRACAYGSCLEGSALLNSARDSLIMILQLAKAIMKVLPTSQQGHSSNGIPSYKTAVDCIA